MAGSDQFEATRASVATNSVASVDTTAVELAAANEQREGLIICNDTDKKVYIHFGDVAVIDTAGVFVLAAGATYESGQVVFTGSISAITAESPTAGVVYVTELTK